MSSRARRPGVLAVALLLLVSLAGPASASPETLKRSVSNVLFGPLDVAFTPVVSARNVINNLQNVDDTMGVRVAYAVPGYVWNMGVQIGAGTIRVLTGVIEFLPGLGLFFFDADLDPLFSPVERGQALVDYDTPPLNIKFGITYTE
ncbi:MAG TPA: hypothetical protein VII72_08565 [Myxococcota bacterium]